MIKNGVPICAAVNRVIHDAEILWTQGWWRNMI